MGAGPRRLVELGLPARLEKAGHTVHLSDISLPSPLPEIASAFALAESLAEAVRSARRQHAFPLVLSGNCNSCLGTIAGLADPPARAPNIGVAWFDAHADFNTPETSESGFLDGMALATLAGDCWGLLASGIRGFAPVPLARVALVGARELDRLEATRTRERSLTMIPASGAAADVEATVNDCWAGADELYIHIDLDVLDPTEGRANSFATPGGLSLAGLRSTLSAMAAVRTIGAAAISAYDPGDDVDGRAGQAALEVAEHVLALASRPLS